MVHNVLSKRIKTVSTDLLLDYERVNQGNYHKADP